jgi:ATP-dependent helicase YprA (DUF1998 family)
MLLSQDRRKIEREAFSGNLLGLVATNALELGIDIGTLDAVIMLGFPFSIASFVSYMTALVRNHGRADHIITSVSKWAVLAVVHGMHLRCW